MNALAKYLDEKEMTPSDLARLMELPVSTVWRWTQGKGIRCENALKVENVTDGAVTLRDLLTKEQ